MKVHLSPPHLVGFRLLLIFLTEVAHSRPCQDWCGHLGQEAGKRRTVQPVLRLTSWLAFPAVSWVPKQLPRLRLGSECFCDGGPLDGTLLHWYHGAATKTLQRKLEAFSDGGDLEVQGLSHASRRLVLLPFDAPSPSSSLASKARTRLASTLAPFFLVHSQEWVARRTLPLPGPP